MEPGFVTYLLAAGLGLLGFIEPCTVAAHLILVRSLLEKERPARFRACATFIAVRVVTFGAVGVLAALAGRAIIDAQTTLWLVFGAAYAVLGLAYLSGSARWLKFTIGPRITAWSATRSPVLLGVVFGLNIPACAAPILFAVIGAAATTGSIASGSTLMVLFGLALSLPLFLFVGRSRLARLAEWIGRNAARVRVILGIVFLVLGVWSVWFGLFVDPAEWRLS